MGAWIEIILKSSFMKLINVAPHVGAWIEILMKERFRAKAEVAPHVGAWIEMQTACGDR